MSWCAACEIALVPKLKQNDVAFPATASGAGDAAWSAENGNPVFNLRDQARRCRRAGGDGFLCAENRGPPAFHILSGSKIQL